MSTSRRAEARAKGLRLAAKVATVSGLAVAALGLIEARAAASAHATSTTSATESASAATTDDALPLPMEGWAKVTAGNCGCAPCWGPPAPPAMTRAAG